MRRQTYLRSQSTQTHRVSATQAILGLAILSMAQSLGIIWLVFA